MALSGLPDTPLLDAAAGGQSFSQPVTVTTSAPAGGALIVANSHTTPTSPTVQYTAQSAADLLVGLQVTGDAVPRMTIDSNGQIKWGPGTAGADVSISRAGSGLLQTNAMKMVNNSAGGSVLFVQNTHVTPTAPSVTLHAQQAADQTLGISVTGDAQQRMTIDSNGVMAWGSGAAGTDTNLYRSSAGVLKSDNMITAQSVAISGLTGATAASRFAGAVASGVPTSGTFAVGDVVISQAGRVKICTGAGSPGTWTDSAGISGVVGNIQPSPGTAAAGASGASADSSHVHGQPPMFAPTGLTGATSSGRWVGTTVAGPPTSGTFAVGDFVNDQAGDFWTCVTAGSPGLWNAAGGNDYFATQQVASGETTIPRFNVGTGPALTSGKVQFTYFTASKTEVCTQLISLTNSIAAAATPTVCQMGLYSVDSSGNLTSVAITANDTTMWAATFTQYNRTVTTFTKVAGQRYAFALLVVTAVAAPNFFGYNGTLAFGAINPVLYKASATGQTSLLSSYTAGSLLGTSMMHCSLVSP